MGCNKLTWWQRGVIYEVYPRSFQDSNGDGIGDLAGIHRRIDYLVQLGVDALWLSPIYPSPMADFGYDIADYCNIDPTFGTLAEFDPLLAEVHARGLKLILDFVPQPHLRPAPLVPRKPLLPHQPQARLVSLARRAQQLALQLRRPPPGSTRPPPTSTTTTRS